MNILVRLDVSKQIGTGHFRRMFNLSQFMKEFNFIFLISTDNKDNNLFKDLNVIFLDNEKAFKSLLQKLEFNLIIFDLLHYKEDYIKSIKSIIPTIPLVCFHEYEDYSDYSDLIVNYNLLEKSTSNRLYGYEYIIFSEDIKGYKIANKENYIFVSFGGSDPSNLTEKFILSVASKLDYLNFKIHIGNFNNIKIRKNFNNIEYLEQPKNLFKYMANASLAISAGGNMMYELIYMSVPSLIIAHNAHQEQFAKNAESLGYIDYIGLFEELNFTLLKEKIISCYRNEEVEIKNGIDTNGKYRILKAIKDLINK